MSEVVYAIEPLAACQAEMEPLIIDHWKEIAVNQSEIPLDVDWSIYEALERAKILLIVSCRIDGDLIGYSFWVIKPHPHYKSTVFATNDVIFLKSEYRKSRIGYGLIRASEEAVKKAGAQKISWHVKITNDWTPLLKRLGYEVEEMVAGKWIGD